ncbi:MAG TPA: glycosyltransferase family 39 protein, partial [Anaerolineae bacterium]|nr:glycosyltransferase family 39 protein [Anaerolineae bacterium]
MQTANTRTEPSNIPTRTAATSGRIYRWLMVLLLLAQTYLLTFRLANQSMWTDEMYTSAVMHLPNITDVIEQVRRIERRPPLQFVSIWAWSKAAGDSDFSLRFFSVACTLLTTGLAFTLGRQLASERAGWWAALLTATAPTLLLY